jgi:hypothetical protein
MIAIHHRSVFRYARNRWRGARRLLLGPAAVALAVRAGIEMVARALGARRERPQVGG